MGMPVITVAAGGLPVVDVSALAPTRGTPVTEATNGRGVAVTKVAAFGAPVVYETIGVATPVVYVTWDVATITAVTLSGGNLVATSTGTTSADQGAKVVSASGKTSGKYYFEITFTSVGSLGPNLGVGIATTASTYTGMGNNATTGVGLYKTTAVWANGSNVLSVFTGVPGINASMDTGDMAGIAVDLDNRRAWFRTDPAGAWNNNASANPATNVGGFTIPAGTMVPICTFGGTGALTGQVLTANFGASAFVGAVPPGFTAGWTP